MGRQVSMRPSLNLVISAPYITLDKFCDLTGYKLAYARQMIKENRLPIRKKAGAASLIEVNMLALTVEAARATGISIQA